MYGRTLTSTLVLALLLAAPAQTAGERASLTMPFKAATPATQTGLDMDLRYLDPDDPEGRPPTISKLVLRLPEGTRIDPSALPTCEATNEEIQARGRDACPPETVVGGGKLQVYLGAPNDPQNTDLVLFNGPQQIIEVLLFEGTNNTAAIERLRVEGSVISGEPVQVPPGAPPDRRFSASRIVWDVPPNGRYLTTPPACEGSWITRGEFEFADGSSARTESSQPCSATPGEGSSGGGPPGGGPSPSTRRFRVSVSRRTLVRGRAARLRVTVRGDAACRNATVRVGRRALRTGADGRGTLVALVRFLRRPKLRVQTPCGRAYVTLRTRAR